jgi:hypothetical protein
MPVRGDIRLVLRLVTRRRDGQERGAALTQIVPERRRVYDTNALRARPERGFHLATRERHPQQIAKRSWVELVARDEKQLAQGHFVDP